MSATTYRNGIRRREHKERAQPTARAHLGLLEKHKDYVKRAKNFHEKEARIKNLRYKAENRNPDEFYFKMYNEKTKGGVHDAKNANADMSADELKLLKSQDRSYLRTVRRKEERVSVC